MTISEPLSANDFLVQSVVDCAIYALTPEGRVSSWNAGAERIKGYAAQEIIGEHFSRFYSEEDRAAGVPERALKTARDEGRFTAEAWRYRKDGSRFWAMVLIDPIYLNGELVGFAKITRDMSEQREAQRATMESERRFRLLVEGVTDYAIYMLDPTGHVTNWNAGAARIKGYEASEIVGQHFSRFYTPEDVASGVPQKALETARRVGRFEAEAWRVRKDGARFWASVVIDAIYDEGELIGFAKVTRDLTERRAAQQEIDRSREELLQSQKMESIGQLTGGLAHDFNNLLTAITGSLDIIKARLSRGSYSDLERFIDAAHGSAMRAASLTHRLLAFARRQTLEPKPTDVNRLISEMMDQLIVRTIGPLIHGKTKLAPDLWLTLCDPHQLENALLNLSINARDAMPDGGSLTVETANVSLDKEAARLNGLTSGGYISIVVSDTGSGMTPDVAAHAFDPFYTTKPFGLGTGLGLSMAYGFVRQSGGQIKIDTKVGVGTAIRLYLPQYRGSAATEAPVDHRPAGENLARPGATILVVDDEPMVRMLITEVLQDAGHSILEASDGGAALKILLSDVQIDLLVTDVGLPSSLNGRQLADAARIKRPNLKVLFVTGYAESAARGDGRLEPGMSMLAKPFAVDALATKVLSILSESCTVVK
jgi:PAS domain S-box-containing protein